jgi:hypothetical protein
LAASRPSRSAWPQHLRIYQRPDLARQLDEVAADIYTGALTDRPVL